MKVFFCTDGSDASYYALKKSLPLIKKGALIDIFYVIDWGYFPTYVTFPAEEEVMLNSKEVAKIIIGKSEEIIAENGFKTNKKEFVSGSPSSQILNKIRENNYDLVVMGSHGKKGLENWLGSVSRKVVSGSHVPILVARPEKNENIITVKKSPEILFAADGSSFSYNAMKKSMELFEIEKCIIDIVTVRPGIEALPLEITMDPKWLESCLEKQKEIAGEILESSVNIFSEQNYTVRESKSLEGNIAEKILKLSEKKEYDLLVMGSHGREGVSDMLLGSISKRVLNNSFVPVLIVPTKK